MLEPECGPFGGCAGRRMRRGAVSPALWSRDGVQGHGASDPPYPRARAVLPLRVAGFSCMRATVGQARHPVQLVFLPSCLPTALSSLSPFLSLHPSV